MSGEIQTSVPFEHPAHWKIGLCFHGFSDLLRVILQQLFFIRVRHGKWRAVVS